MQFDAGRACVRWGTAWTAQGSYIVEHEVYYVEAGFPIECVPLLNTTNYLEITNEADFGRAFTDPQIECAAVVNDLFLTRDYWGES
eukprot:5082891-Pyramimonas_sp.AAC.1